MRPIDPAKWPELMTPAEVAQIFRVHPKTPARWEAAGRISSIRTPGGHRRFERAEVLALYNRYERNG